jgi:hypothetical protein
MSKLSQEESLFIDFDSVEGITASAADEVISKLLIDRASNSELDCGFVLVNVELEVLETIDIVLKRAKLSCIVADRNSHLKMVGFGEYLNQTLEVAVRLRSFTAGEIAKEIGISAPGMNNRLQKLYSAGALARSGVTINGGGKEYKYEVVQLTKLNVASV